MDKPKISGFTFVRNGITFGYPFVQSIQSLLPVVDELIVVVGDSTDGTREAIGKINDKKIRIVDTVWDENLRKSGKIFAQQSNLGLQHTTGDWAFHLQVDEVLHETAAEKILHFINLADKREDVDGLLFPFQHFWGDFKHIHNTRRTHRLEIRAFKNTKKVFSYKDSQGFRKYSSKEAYDSGEAGEKLRVLNTEVSVFHYSHSRHPALMKKKSNYFHRFWHDDKWLKEKTNEQLFDFNEVDKLEMFTGQHPSYMKDVIAAQDWDFSYDPSQSNMKMKDKLLNGFEEIFGYRLFEYRNYKLVKP